MTVFDGSSPELIFHLRAAINSYLDKLQTDLSQAYDILAEVNESKMESGAAVTKVNEIIHLIDEAQTAFARLPFTVKPRPDYL